MGIEALYYCKECGEKFKAREGGGFMFMEYRCVDCDTIKCVGTMNRSVLVEDFIPPTAEEIGICDKCGGELRDDIKPMCPNCKSRNVDATELGGSIAYD